MGYVIHLSTELANSQHFNEYGYWEGKTYRVQGEEYPMCDTNITSETKVYKSRVRVENMAGKLHERCGHVLSWSIEEV